MREVAASGVDDVEELNSMPHLKPGQLPPFSTFHCQPSLAHVCEVPQSGDQGGWLQNCNVVGVYRSPGICCAEKHTAMQVSLPQSHNTRKQTRKKTSWRGASPGHRAESPGSSISTGRGLLALRLPW